MNVIQINKFSQLHDGETIIFCKTDFVPQELDRIGGMGHDVILVTGNSDYCITDTLADRAPRNIKKWFCQNRLSDNPLLESIPIGLDNSTECGRKGHGVAWNHATIKHEILSDPPHKEPRSFVFSCFTVGTNPQHRARLKNISQESDHITWREPDPCYGDYVDGILGHEAVLCAQGNGGGDNHRIYETLYLGRTPLTFNRDLHKYLHYLFPVVLIEEVEDIRNKSLLKERVKTARADKSDEFLDADFWIDRIKKEADKL